MRDGANKRALPALFVLAAAVGACTSTPPPTAPAASPANTANVSALPATSIGATGSPSATASRSQSASTPAGSSLLLPQLEGIALQPDDLNVVATDFQEFDVGATANADRLPPPQAATDRFGRIGGWKARFRQPSQVVSGVITVDSRVDLFADATGASQDLAAYSDRYKAQATEAGGQVSNVQLGDQPAVLYVTPPAAGSVQTAMLAWQRGPFTSQIVASSLGSGDPAAAAQSLAAAVDARMAAALNT